MNKPFKDYVHAEYPRGSVIQRYGVLAPVYKLLGLDFHNGIDFVNTINRSYGTEMLAVEKGIVVWVEDRPNGYGTHCKILSKTGVGRIYNEWTYGHLSRLDVKKGQVVQAGERIGLMGNSGMVTRQGLDSGNGGSAPIYQWGWTNPDQKGTHLHLTKRIFEELDGAPTINNAYNIQYLNSIRGNILNYNNGARGGVDFMEDLDNIAPSPLKNTTERDRIKIEVLNTLFKYVNNPAEVFKKFLSYFDK